MGVHSGGFGSAENAVFTGQDATPRNFRDDFEKNNFRPT